MYVLTTSLYLSNIKKINNFQYNKRHIKLAQKLDLSYVYLGYWVPGSSKMGYKSKYSALEIYHEKEWKKLIDVPNVSSKLHPLNTAPVAEQVSELDFPGSEAVR